MTKIPRKRIVGYSDKLTVAPGETIAFKVNCEDGAASYRADIVRLICGDDNSVHPGFRERLVNTAANGVYPGRRQVIYAGSYVVVPPSPVLDELASFTLQAMIWPTTPLRSRQALLGRWCNETSSGYLLEIDETGAVALRLGDGTGRTVTISTDQPLLERRWYAVAATYDAASGRVRVVQQPWTPFSDADVQALHEPSVTLALKTPADSPFMMAAAYGGFDTGRIVNIYAFNGKIDRPRLVARALDATDFNALRDRPHEIDGLVAAWDFSTDIATDRVVDISRHSLDGRVVNLPSRAVTGYNWTGEVMNWQGAPEQYGAIHFHEDDLYDAGWQTDFELTVPDDQPSGVYAGRVAVEDDEDHILFFVRPPRGKPAAKLAFLASTATYMAYGNNHTALDAELREMARGELIKLRKDDIFLNEHREYGLAAYDHHVDGSGVFYSSRLRPILNMRPKTYQWSFNADTHITDWLDALGIEHDVITDEILHEEGLPLLSGYRAVMTGSHPEYLSIPMWTAVRDYLDDGGRLMYMGGNGFYWRIAFRDGDTTVLEVRRAESGTRAWAAEPGEYYHSFTGEYGGLWQRLGRPPNDLVGVGYIAQGFDKATYYRRKPGSFDARASWIFDGVGAEEKIGDFGLVYGGAAGSEIDRHNRRLGSPPHALVLASSEQHTNVYYAAIENETELMPMLSAPENPDIRADMVYFETPKDGAVWSTGSIAWSGSLSHNIYDNNVSRITRNVVDRFVDPKPF